MPKYLIIADLMPRPVAVVADDPDEAYDIAVEDYCGLYGVHPPLLGMVSHVISFTDAKPAGYSTFLALNSPAYGYRVRHW